MTHPIRLAIIAVLMVSLGVWVGLSLPKDIDKIPDCDASLGWCFNDGEGVSLQVLGTANKNVTSQALATSPVVRINARGVNAEHLIGRITGINMYMGQFDVTFERQNDRWTGLTSMPSCVESQPMVWNIELFKANNEAGGTGAFTPTNVNFTFSGQQK